MKYEAFERLVLLLGAASVLATLAIASGTPLLAQEIVAQLLVFVVLVGAVHWGRRGGLLAAIGASLVYAAMWIFSADLTEMTPQLLALMLTRVFAYGLIGIVGGALCAKMKYVLASLEHASGVDGVTGIYSEQMLAPLLDNATARFERYVEPYSLIVIEPRQLAMRSPSNSRERALVRRVAGHIRGDIRLMDDAGRTADGRFVVILPHTDKSGGQVATDRLLKNLRTSAGANDPGSFDGHCLGAAEDATAIAKLRAGLTGPGENHVLSPA